MIIRYNFLECFHAAGYSRLFIFLFNYLFIYIIIYLYNYLFVFLFNEVSRLFTFVWQWILRTTYYFCHSNENCFVLNRYISLLCEIVKNVEYVNNVVRNYNCKKL